MRGRSLAVGAMVAAGLLAPLPRHDAAAPRSPVAAARLVEEASGPPHLSWGKLRAWRRLGDGWLVLWQPAHGAWVLRALVRDGPHPVLWRLQVAPWLPGVRPSEPLARELVGAREAVDPRRIERLARRDWEVSGQRLAGALPLGRDLPELPAVSFGPWPALLAGTLLAGALCLVLLPGNLTQRWTLALAGALVGLVAVTPSVVAVGYPAFRVGVRPWVAQLAIFAAVSLVATALLAFAARFGALEGRPRALELGAAAGLGLLAGRLAPAEPLTAVAGLTARPVVWLAVAVTLGYLASVAAIGLRELLHPVRRLRLPLLASLLVAAVVTAGAWLGPLAAMLVAAAGPRARACWTATTLVAFWIVGCTLASCAWVEPLRDAGLLLLGGAGVLVMRAAVEE